MPSAAMRWLSDSAWVLLVGMTRKKKSSWPDKPSSAMVGLIIIIWCSLTYGTVLTDIWLVIWPTIRRISP